jgi:hypothetical protein
VQTFLCFLSKFYCIYRKELFKILNNGLKAQAGIQVVAGQVRLVCSCCVLDVSSLKNEKKNHTSFS